MDLHSFTSYAQQGYNRIPLVHSMVADQFTPLTVYSTVANAPHSYLFESMQGGERWSRYSFIGLPVKTTIEISGQQVREYHQGDLTAEHTVDDPLAWIDQYRSRFKALTIDALPRVSSGLVGYFGYETVQYIEPKLAAGIAQLPDEIGMADIKLMLSDQVIVFDNQKSLMHVVVFADVAEGSDASAIAQSHQQASEKIEQIAAELYQVKHLPELNPDDALNITETDFTSRFGEAEFKGAVEQCRDYIRAGDIMQVVLSQRLQVAYNAPEIDLYRALRILNPSPYMYFLNMGDACIVGSSPEILVRLNDQEVSVRPIAGTRKRGADAARDLELEQELLADPKEIAEHLMLIDLGRNDVGRVAQVGSVELTENMSIERYSHVMHIVSNVDATLDPQFDAMDVLKATFPAGTVSGAPKIRAMEIIHELEPCQRGVYSGAVGYLDWYGNLDTAIAIRTAVIKDGVLSIQAGAGVVYDSKAELEWKETMNKARAVVTAAQMASSGLQPQPLVHSQQQGEK